MMMALLVYGYCTGVMSSRRIERKTYEDVAFRYLSGGQHPEFSTICTFRRTHLAAVEDLFRQVVRLAREAGLVKMGHVSLDGSKVDASASKHKAMRARTTKSYACAGESRTACRPDRRATTA
jgi:transposase